MDTRTTAAISAEILALMGRTRTPQTRLADALGVSQPTLSRRLRGDEDAKPWDLDELDIVCRYFGVSISELITRAYAPPSLTAGAVNSRGDFTDCLGLFRAGHLEWPAGEN